MEKRLLQPINKYWQPIWDTAGKMVEYVLEIYRKCLVTVDSKISQY